MIDIEVDYGVQVTIGVICAALIVLIVGYIISRIAIAIWRDARDGDPMAQFVVVGVILFVLLLGAKWGLERLE